MTNKIILLKFALLLSLFSFSQKIELINDTAYVDGKEYILLEKLNRKKYEVKNTETNEKILEVELFKVYNSHTNRKHKLPKILFININETMEFEIDIQNELELVKFLFEWEIVFLNGQPNEKKAFDHLQHMENQRKQNGIEKS